VRHVTQIGHAQAAPQREGRSAHRNVKIRSAVRTSCHQLLTTTLRSAHIAQTVCNAKCANVPNTKPPARPVPARPASI